MAFTNDVPNARHIFPLTDAQLGIWMGDQVSSCPNAFTIAHSVTIDGDLDVVLLAQSIHTVLSESDTIQACYVEQDDGQPSQIFGSQAALVPDIIYVTDKDTPLDWVQKEVEKDVAAPLSLASDKPLCHQVLYVIPEESLSEHIGFSAPSKLSKKVIWYQRFHHIMLDGYSLNAFTRQVSLYYQRALSSSFDLVAPFTSFSEVVEEELAYKASPRYLADKTFWRNYVSQLEPITSLSLGENSTDNTPTFIRQHCQISKSLLDQCVDVSMVKSVTPADVALALVFSYLHKMTGQHKVTVCFPFMGRMGSVALTALGPVVNVLPLQVVISPDTALDDLIGLIKAELKSIRKHQKYNAEQIARDMGQVSEIGLFCAPTVNLLLFDYDLSFTDVPVTIQHLATGPVDDLDFNMHFDAITGDLNLEWVANGNRYNEPELVQHATRFMDFTTRLAADPAVFIPTMTVASDDELAQNNIWQYSPYPDATEPFVDIVDQFFNRSSVESEQLAICSGQVELSHNCLTEKALQWARVLKVQGVSSGDRIGLALPRDERIVIAMFALMRLRVTYVPMDPEYPMARLEWMLEDAKPVAILTTRALGDFLPENSPCIFVDDDEFLSLANQQSAETWQEIQYKNPQDAAYIMYTSGSTGKPKGVSIPYQGIANLFYAHYVADYKPLLDQHPRQVRAVHTASFSFDGSWDMLLWLMLGQAVFIIDEEMRRDAYALVEYIQKEELDTMDVPPSFLMQMLDAGLLAKDQYHPYGGWIGGEAASPSLWERMREHPDFVMKNYYGPTENSVDSIGCSGQDSAQVIIGRPICNTRAYLLDEYLQPVPIGVVAELYVAGPGLAHGYINRPAQTASRFVANPFIEGERMYRTGDLARYLADGQIEYIGRSDHQVQIRGFRVEPGEIESVLASLERVTAAVVNTDKQGNGYRLLAYCVVPDVSPENEGELTEQILVAAAAVLPDYMVPNAIKVLPEFTLNVNGKVDRFALPKINATHTKVGRLPQTIEEAHVCTAMADCLGLDNVYADDDFFHLGGDSITAMSLGNVLRQQGYRLRPKDVFSGKTAHQMAKHLICVNEDSMKKKSVVHVAGLLRDLPILHWFEEHGGLCQRYIQAVFIRIPEKVTERIIQQALDALMTMHPILGARVHEDALVIPDSYSQKNNGLISHTHNLGAPLEQQADQAFTQLVDTIDPITGPLMQVCWLETDHDDVLKNEDHYEKGLVIAIHHLAVDGVSWRILLPELKDLCERIIRRTTVMPEREDTSLRQWQNVLNDQVSTYRKQKRFWKQQLEPQQTPLFQHNKEAKHSDLEHHRILLSVEQTKALLVLLPKAYRSHVEEVLLTVTTLAFSRHFKTADMRYTLESHGRAELADACGNISDLSRTVGWLTAEYPVRFSLTDPLFHSLQSMNVSYEKAIQSVRKTLLGVGEKGLGYGVLRYLDEENRAEFEELDIQNRPSVLFNYLGRFREGEGEWVPQTTDHVFQDTLAVHQSDEMPQCHPIELNIFVQENGADAQLALQWSWLPSVCAQTDITAVTEYMGFYAEQMMGYTEQHPANAADTLVVQDIDLLDIEEGALAMLRGQYGGLDDVLPVLPLQEGLLFHAQMEKSQPLSNGSSYSTLVRLVFCGPLNVVRLRKALAAVIIKYPQLGAIFDVVTLSQPVQILPWRRPEQLFDLWPLDEIDLMGLSDPEQSNRLDDIENNELHRDFMALQSAGVPLLHGVLVQLDKEKHTLILNAHHLLLDGWSTPILLRELLVAYDNEAVTLDEPSVSYSSLVNALCTRDKTVMRDAWQQCLTGVMPTMAFGEYPPNRAVTTYKQTLSADKFKQLSKAYKQRGVTLNSVLQVVWANVLFTMTGRSDVVFGTPISGRFSPVEGIDEHIGLFSNTIPVRVQLAPERTLWEQIQAVQEQQVSLMEHDGLGLGELQRLAGHSTLFDTLLVVENYPDQDNLHTRLFHGMALTEVHNRGYTHYPLTVLVLPSEHLDILFEFRGNESSIDIIMARFASLLDTLLDGDNPLQSHLNLQTESEKNLIEAVNRTTHGVPNSTLREQMWAQFERTPEAICLLDEAHILTYRESREQVIALAKELQHLGVKPGDIVAVALPRSIRLTLSLWAISEVGAAFLPLDTGYPDDRLNYMLDDAQPSALITLHSEVSRFTSPRVFLFFESLFEKQEGCLENWRAPKLMPENAAYLLYTSGSTGKPKGVLVSHRAIVNRILWMQNSYAIDETDVVLQKTPCSFDVSVWEFFWSSMVGARLVMAPPESHRDPHAMRELIDVNQITTMHFVPSMLAAFIGTFASEVKERDSHRLCPSLRQVFCSGEALSTELSVAFEQVFSTPLHNLYGPTEAAVDVTYHPAYGKALARVDGVNVPIGKPVWNTQLRILDDYLRPTPVGVSGELYLTGIQLAMGYLHRPELTATRFVADPYAHGERMYRTGDVVRWLEDGNVEYLGRSDDQLKIRGQRIELGEIERVLLAQEGVNQCAVVAKAWGVSTQMAGSDSRQLVGYIVPDNGITLESAALRHAMANELPTHMVPVVVVPLDALPLSANGKLDRNALPLPRAQEATEGRMPTPGIETKLADTFARILSVERIYADDDFFALGGHSLLAVRLVADLHRQWQLNVSVGQVMVSPSVEKLAHILSDEQLANNRDFAGFGLVLPIRQGHGLPVFCVHPASGFAWQYTGLSRYLNSNGPLIGLQSPRPDGPISAQGNMEGIIEQHLNMLRQHQKQGPYRLMGYSLGGVIAHGIAVRLQDMGEYVDFLGLIDTYPPDGQDWSGPTEDEAKQEVEREKAQFMNRAEEQMESKINDEKDGMFDDIVANYADSIRHLSAAKSRYFNGKATLFVADRTLPTGMDIEATWAPFVGELIQYHFDYPHEDILSPNALVELGPLMNKLINALDDERSNLLMPVMLAD